MQNKHLKKLMGYTLACSLPLFAAAALVADEHENKKEKKEQVKEEVKEYTDETFIKHGVQANLAEIALGRMAAEKSRTPEVREFSQKLIQDHSQAQRNLLRIAQEKNLSLPTQLDEKHQQKLEEIGQLSGPEFEKEFAKHMLKGHRKGVAMLHRAHQKTEDEQIKAFAQQLLPTLKQHLKLAENMAQAVGLDQETIASIGKEEAEAIGGPGFDVEVGEGEAEEGAPETPGQPGQPRTPQPQQP
jgi:putative membrane protein